jgi:hypothetical protein
MPTGDKPQKVVIEKMDVKNIIEIDRIRVILKNEKDLLSLFDEMCEIVNKTINDEKIYIEDNRDNQ